MGFRNPITSAAAVDTGQPSTAGMRIYQGSDATGVYGVLEARDGIVGDNPMQLIARANMVPQGGGYTQQGGGVALKGGSYNGSGAPEIDLNVEGLPAGGYGPVARISRPWEPIAGPAAVPVNSAYFANFSDGSSYSWPTCWLLASGEVRVTGMVGVNSNAFALNTTVATLPAGYRPAKVERFLLNGWGFGGWIAEVQVSGAITYAGGLTGSPSSSGSFLSLAGIAFVPAPQ